MSNKLSSTDIDLNKEKIMSLTIGHHISLLHIIVLSYVQLPSHEGSACSVMSLH